MDSVAKTIKHPKGIYAIFSLQLLGMMGFSMIYALIVLYATHHLHFSDANAYEISAAFNALAFATSVPGGYIAEKYLGFRVGAFISIVLGIIGMILLAIPSSSTLYVGLAFFILSAGMLIPCLYVLLGNLYGEENPHREHGFVIAYVGMNIGAFIASAISGTVANTWSYSASFMIGAIATIVMLPILLYFYKIFHEETSHLTLTDRCVGIILVLITLGLTIAFVYYANISNSLLLILGVASLLFLLKIAFNEEKETRNKLIVFMLLTTISIMFWTLYSLGPSALTLFTDRNVDRHIANWIIPTANLSCLNPFFIMSVGPLMGILWSNLKKINFTPSLTTKFAIGTLLMGIGYLVLVIGIHFHNPAGYIALFWLVLSYFSQTMGELLVGPIGYAMVGDLVPIKMQGTMMGIWQLACGIGGALSEHLAKYTSTSGTTINPLATNAGYSHAFGIFGYVTIAIGIGALLLAPYLTRLAHP